jgi:hypothetical protein
VIWTVLLGAALATAPEEQALFDALLDAPVAEIQAPPALPAAPPVPWWPVPAGILGMGLLWAARRKVLGGFETDKGHGMQVHSRVALGQGSGLAIVEIETPAGPRMLLMGVGSGSAPRLVADLEDRFRDELIDGILNRGES